MPEIQKKKPIFKKYINIHRRDRSVGTKRQPSRFRIKYVLQFISSLLLPLVLAIFTFVISIQQEDAARQQRDLDKSLSAAEQHKAEAERVLQRNITAEKYKNELFDTYIKEIGQMLEKYNGSLLSNDVAVMLIRAKTLNMFRRLDPQHNIYIIRFLYEAQLHDEIRENRSLNLSTAKL
ncbi:unnamed protein product, partial [Rotaria sp. Silwood1]